MASSSNRYCTSNIHDVIEIRRNPSADYDPEPNTLAAVRRWWLPHYPLGVHQELQTVGGPEGHRDEGR